MPLPSQRLVYLVTEDWYVCSHRLPLIRAAGAAGFDVAVVTRVREHAAPILATGARLIPLDWERKAVGPAALARDILRLRSLYRDLRPDLVHHIAVKPAVLGGIAARLAGVPRIVTTLAGRGRAMSGDGVAAKLAGALFKSILFGVEASGAALTVVQNADDAAWIRDGLGPKAVVLIRGSGVDLERMRPLPMPEGPVTVAQVSRMLTLKGVETLVAAIKRLRGEGMDIRLLLAGGVDNESRAAVPESQLLAWSRDPGLTWLGHVPDVATVWAQASIAVLASTGGEGVPKSLLEAAAFGRPIVATDVPGNREIALADRNALLVPPGDVDRLAAALRSLALDPSLRSRMGTESRSVVDPDFGDTEIVGRTIEIYRRLLNA